jgi:hypothetical protein
MSQLAPTSETCAGAHQIAATGAHQTQPWVGGCGTCKGWVGAAEEAHQV